MMDAKILQCEIAMGASMVAHAGEARCREMAVSQAARNLAHGILKTAGLVKVLPGRHEGDKTYRVSCGVLDRHDADALAKQLAEAEHAGAEKALRALEASAAVYATLGHFGPAQALAMRGFARDYRARNKNPGATREGDAGA